MEDPKAGVCSRAARKLVWLESSDRESGSERSLLREPNLSASGPEGTLPPCRHVFVPSAFSLFSLYFPCAFSTILFPLAIPRRIVSVSPASSLFLPSTSA